MLMEELLGTVFTEDGDGRWITYMEPGGFWVTHPKDGRNIPGGAEVAEVVDGYDVRTTE